MKIRLSGAQKIRANNKCLLLSRSRPVSFFCKHIPKSGTKQQSYITHPSSDWPILYYMPCLAQVPEIRSRVSASYREMRHDHCSFVIPLKSLCRKWQSSKHQRCNNCKVKPVQLTQFSVLEYIRIYKSTDILCPFLKSELFKSYMQRRWISFSNITCKTTSSLFQPMISNYRAWV